MLRALRFLLKAALLFVGVSVLWVAIYRFVPPPTTITMLTDPHGARREWVPLDHMDPNMARAAIAGEDAHFCLNHGFELTAIKQAARHNENGGRIHGGSTISQQTAKNVFLWQGGGYLRKAIEAWFTLLIEAIWGKHRIMEMYLNVAETGIGTYGAQAAAERYFHHGAGRLSPTEAARIAAILPLPKKRTAVDPHGFVRRHGNAIGRYEGMVRRAALDACLR